MSYKPPKQTIDDNDLKGVPSNEAVFEALKLKLPKPSVDGTTGQLLARGASADDTSWVNPPSALPSQTGNVNKVLVTDGSSASWQFAGLGAGSLGSGNVIVGRSKPASLTGTENVIAGALSGDALSSGIRNVLLGVYSGGDLSSGLSNTLVGWATGYVGGKGALLSTGSYNVLVGSSATTAATSTSNAVGIGYWSNVGSNSVSIGWYAGEKQIGQNNVGIGYQSLKGAAGANGNENVAVGFNTLPDVTTAAQNSALGYQAGLQMTDGFANTLVGWGSGNTLTSGIGNTLIGYNCQAASATTNNAFVLGSGSTAGSASIAMGSSVTGGASSVTIGQSSSSSGSTGSIVLGHSSTSSGLSNIMSIGSTVQNVLTTYLGLGAEQILAAGDFKAIKLMTARAGSGGGLTNLNASAGTLTLAGSQGSGTGVGGSVYLATAPAGSSGNTLNAHVNRLEVTATNSGDVKVLTGDLMIETAGKGLSIKEGSNAKMGVTTAFPTGNPNRFTVSTTAITANSRIFLTIQDYTGAHNPSVKVYSRDVGAGNFIIEAGDNSFNGTVAWMLVQPA